MNMDVMKVFCDLVDAGSFSRAAEANYISQSAVSQQLAKLEREFSTQLISRGGGLVAPTESGRAFYEGCREILRRYEQVVGEVRSAASAIRGVLRVGTIYSVGFYPLDRFVRKFIRSHPEVNLHMEYTHWDRIYSAVIGGEMDLGVVACPEKQRSVEAVPLSDEELVMVCSPDHALARRSRIDAAELDDEDFVTLEANIPTQRHIDRILKREKIKVNVVMEQDNIELVKRAISVGAGIGILPKDNVEREVRYGDLAYARFRKPDRWSRPVAILRRRGKAPGPAERTFLAILRGAEK